MARFSAVLTAVSLAFGTAAWAEDPLSKMLELAYAGDTAGVRAALQAAPDPAAARSLFGAFQSTDPRLAEFTEAWLNASPDDPMAQTARGWQLQALGWAMRGTALAEDVYPDAMARMADLHARAWELSQQALAGDPGLLPASDLMLDLAKTTGQTDLVDDEFTRAMTIYPNRQTLRLAAIAKSPKWAGRSWSLWPGAQSWSKTACEDWAGKVADVQDYTPEVCAIDMVFTAGETDEVRDWAADALLISDHPILDGARDTLYLYRPDLGQWDIEWLEHRRDDGTISLDQAGRIDAMRNVSPSDPPSAGYMKVLKREMPKLRLAADRDPGNSGVVMAYFETLYASHRADPEKASNAEEIKERVTRLLEIAPYNSAGWEILANDLAVKMRDSDHLDQAAKAALDLQAKAVVYSNYRPRYVQTYEMFARMAWQYADWQNTQSVEATGKPVYAADVMDADFVCPTVRAIRLMQLQCESPRPDDYSCSSVKPGATALDLLAEVTARGGCATEFAAGPEELALRLPED